MYRIPINLPFLCNKMYTLYHMPYWRMIDFKTRSGKYKGNLGHSVVPKWGKTQELLGGGQKKYAPAGRDFLKATFETIWAPGQK